MTTATKAPPGRPRTSPLTRAEQLRQAKRAQRRRERDAGLTTVELRLPDTLATRLRVAANTEQFPEVLARALDDAIVDLTQWPTLQELAWNRADRWIPAADAFGLYERNWRFVDPARMTAEETALVERLKQRFGGGVLNA